MRWREYEQYLWIWDGWQICQWSIPQRDIAKLINCAVSDKKLSRPLTYTWPRSTTSEIAQFFTNSPTARITRSMSPFNQEGHVDRPRQMATESGAPWRLLVLCRTNLRWSTFYTRVYLYLPLYLYLFLCLHLYLYFYFYSMLAPGVIPHRLVMVKVAVDW